MHSVVPLDEEAVRQWKIVNDGVMGGLSRSRVSSENGTVTFQGEVSLANQGGFASVRTETSVDLSGWDGFELRAEGGGLAFQLRVRTDERFDGVAYRARFQAPDEGMAAVRIPFSALEPTWRGRTLTDVSPFDPSRIRQIGFLIADGHEGPFRLRVERIGVYRDQNER